jgi:hypothetical protein
VSGPIDEIERILAQTDEADEVLRGVVAAVAAQEGVSWAAVAFLEDGVLTVGPAAGTPDETTRLSVTITFNGERVGELLVDGVVYQRLLEDIARRIGPYVLIGWDTGGETWDP